MVKFASFAALGDSFTEGVGDPYADGSGLRGWADRFAEHLAAARPGLCYANLAIRGKLLGEVLQEQIPLAIAMEPDLVSLAAGGNDLLRLRTDPDELARTFEDAVMKLTEAGCTVMVFTGFDPKAFPVLRLIRGKSALLTMHVRDIAARHGCLIADIWPMSILTDRRLWMPDRLHLTPDGHRRVALRACEVAGVEVADDWRAPLAAAAVRPGPAGQAATWLAARWNDVEWASEHAGPYLSRRLHGMSSGDGIVPKRPQLAPVPTLAPGTEKARETERARETEKAAEEVPALGPASAPVLATAPAPLVKHPLPNPGLCFANES
jgi:lysophospholipase L1-like esterase